MAQGILYFADWRSLTLVTRLGSAVLLGGGILLLIGYLTPVASSVVALIATGISLSWFTAVQSSLLSANLSLAMVLVIAVAVVCLGPGAFSLDARLFGRREIVIPDVSRPRD
jgi:uncharacterized membrane protein YphA (DoxX/SURF4 family)